MALVKSSDVIRLENVISERFGCKVEIVIEGAKLVFHYGDNEMLSGILALMGIKD